MMTHSLNKSALALCYMGFYFLAVVLCLGALSIFIHVGSQD